ncbi:hypothetical protein BCR33DRAFT_718372 [Rhizoclosmatium globosum]|uniref:Globin-sensor domain-containing protein n=1 Tax=Rhizoclosmatium globosum TaxID=329046 RepID=A0A1Y2C554_9FUNG|nr:hypothetical protein BCR33DRAFT_718372 [Rhizoclosmatium globosum]|eukprot:ORY42172.1 hypothetical protein BCR33DRAFT_718372 [Rhizoclosmatium globosum]
MAPAAKINVVDRDRLYTDLQYRFQYVSQVRSPNPKSHPPPNLTPLIAPLVPVIVDAVYDHLFRHTAASLDTLTTEDEQIKFRKDFLGKYLVKLVTAEYDAKFIHTTTPDKKSKINVEYIHCNALFGWLHGFLAETVDALPQLQGEKMTAARAKTLAAFSKLLWIQNDFFAMYYLRDSEVFRGKVAPKNQLLKNVGISSERGLVVVAAVALASAAAAWALKK